MQLQTTNYRVCSMSKDVMNVTSWPTASMFRNWVSVVLSRVQTLSGLYLVKPIDIDKSFEPSDELRKYIKNATEKECLQLSGCN